MENFKNLSTINLFVNNFFFVNDFVNVDISKSQGKGKIRDDRMRPLQKIVPNEPKKLTQKQGMYQEEIL